MAERITREFHLENISPLHLFGQKDENLQIIEKELTISIVARGEKILLTGSSKQVKQGLNLFHNLLLYVRKKGYLHRKNLQEHIGRIKNGKKTKNNLLNEEPVFISLQKKPIKYKTPKQKEYIASMRYNDMVFAIGPAGTGKTYLAVAMAINSLTKRLCNRIILVRPAVEAGESLGFLPGDLKDKVDPYLRPLYDALFDMLSVDKVQHYIATGLIEIAPLAYMRGRTLNDSFVILDEAQNTTVGQMKMFLTRMGFNSKVVVTGDVTQIDLPVHQASGLVAAHKILHSIDDISFVKFTDKDVVRHHLVQDIINAFQKFETESSN